MKNAYIVDPRSGGLVYIALTLVTAACSGAHRSRDAAIAESPLVELRLAYVQPTGDHVASMHRDNVYYVSRSALLSDTSITAAQPTLGPSGELYLRVRYSDGVDERLASTTKEHVGGRLALFLESRLVDVIPIASGAGGRGHLTINTGLRGEEAERFATRIRAKWPTW